MNNVHEKLFKEIKMIQEEVVYTALIENPDLKDLLFDITYDTIFKLLEVFDGYRNDPSLSWNNKNNVNKYYLDGYTPGSGTGFLPGEKYPGSN